MFEGVDLKCAVVVNLTRTRKDPPPCPPYPSFVGSANAAACLTGPHGAVTQQAEQSGCSRQSVYDHAQKVNAAVEAEHGGGPTRAELVRENEALRQENTQLWEWLFQTIEFPLLQQQKFAVVALAMGLSLNQTLVLSVILLGARAAPSRSTIHRWGQAAGEAAGVVLKRLDHSCKTLVLVGCLDEIFFHGRPVLVGIEPTAWCGFWGKQAGNRQGSTWFKELQPWTSLDYVTSDAGSGLQAGIAEMQRHRRETQPSSSGEGAGRLPHQAGSPAGVENAVEPRGAAMGTGRSSRPERSRRRNGKAATRGR